MKRAAVYYRVSTDGQSVEAQKQLLPEFIEQQGYDLVKEYQEDEISGKYVHTRPALQELLKDVENGKFDVLVAEDTTRIMRCELKAEQGQIYDTLSQHKVSIHTRGEGYLDIENEDTAEILFALHGWKGNKERKDIGRRMKGGRYSKKKKGIPVWGNHQYIYGLRKKTIYENGKAVKHEVLIDKKQAMVVRGIYRLIVEEGKNLVDVALYLNDKGVPTKMGKKWSPPGLSYFLKNTELYGEKHFNHKKDEEGRVISYEVFKVPAILTKDEWHTLREKIRGNRKPGKKPKMHYAFKGRLHCGFCGSKFTQTRGHYVCRNRHYGPKRLKAIGEEKCTDSPYLLAEEIETNIFSRQILKFFRDPTGTLKEWNNFNKEQDKDLKKLKAVAARHDKDIKKLKDKKKVLLDDFLEGDSAWTKEEINQKASQIQKNIELYEDQKRVVERKIRQIEKKTIPVDQLKKNAKLIESVQDEVAEEMERALWKDREALAELADALFTPDTYIEVGPTVAGYQVSFRGEINIARFLEVLKKRAKKRKKSSQQIKSKSISYVWALLFPIFLMTFT